MKNLIQKITLVLLFCSVFAQAGFDLAPKHPWFLTLHNLKEKEPYALEMTERLITDQGLFLYMSYLPYSNWERYLHSHDMADQPAWHGYLLAAYAFKEAVTGEDFDDKMEILADGFLKHYEVTGQPGLIARSLIPDYTGPRLPWMDTPQNNPTKFWMQGPTGAWFRNGIAKGHVNMAAFGCSIPLALERKGQIQLRDTTRAKLISVLLPLVQRLERNDLYIIDWNGRPTEFGNLGPQVLNGFNMMLDLHMLKAASWYDPYLAKRYQKYMKSWHWRINWSLNLLGRATRGIIGDDHGTENRPSISDMQHLSLAYLSLYLQGGDRRKYMKHIYRGMYGIWNFMRYMRNPMFTIPYYATVRGDEYTRMQEVIEDLRDFPLEKYETSEGGVITKFIQPLANRPFDTNYWKSSPFLAITKYPPPRTGQEQVFSSVDYLLAYWMGRYFGVIPEE